MIKGNISDDLVYRTHDGKHRSIHFNNHNDQEYWEKDKGRSEFPCCLCGPIHTFAEGYKYLYFPDLLGAIKSAEIINSSEDKWYMYVKKRVNL